MVRQHGIIGNQELENILNPDVTPPGIEEEVLVEERKMARFSKTAEFKRLKGYIEAKITYYQTFLPDGRVVGTAAPTTKVPTGEEWVIANTIISEFNALLNEYENASEAIREGKNGQ